MLNPYLHFNGDCREAFEFYRSVFGGEFTSFATFGGIPPSAGMTLPEEERDNIMHVSLPVGPTVLMGSDMPSQFGPPPVTGSNFSISFSTESREQTDELMAKMSEGGTVTMPAADMFWGDYFGSCTDKFGVNWMFFFGPVQQ